MEGVLMKNKADYAVAVRKPNNEISVEKNVHKDFSDKVKLFKLPIFRGMLAFVDSVVIGVKVLNYSSNFLEEEDKAQNNNKKIKKDNKASADTSDFEIEEVSIMPSNADSLDHTENIKESEERKWDKGNTLLIAVAIIISMILSAALFMILPVVIINLLSRVIESKQIINIIDAVIRLGIFIGFVILAVKILGIRRIFMYHGAEHKTINCLDNGLELTVHNIKKQSLEHKYCRTGFILFVILLSIVIFMLLPSGSLLWRIVSRILLIPLIAGISYELSCLLGRSDSKIVNLLRKPGLWLQGLTVKEPDDSMIEVAIEAVGAVFNWKEFVASSKASKKEKSTSLRKRSMQSKQEELSKKKDNKSKQTSKEASKPAKESKQVDTSKERITSTTGDASIKEQTGKEQTGKESNSSANTKDMTNISKKDNRGKKNFSEQSEITPVQRKSSKADEEDDEILKALDKYFDSGLKDSGKASGDK